MTKLARLLWLLLLIPFAAPAQIDPVKRRLFQVGYNAALSGHAPLSGYAFYYRNDPHFVRTNLTLRLAIAPVYLDSELGISHALTEFTDLGIGLAGGGFADSYSEIREGKFREKESFVGHSAETSISLYHLINPQQRIPLNLILRGIVHHSIYAREDDTDPAFELPHDRTTCSVRTGLRWGGQEPTLFPSLAMELSLWYRGDFRTDEDVYGYDNDRRVESDSHLFWGQALLAYTLPELKHNFRVSLTAGATVDADRFSAYRLGALLPLAAEFPLSLPGYYFEELSAERFGLAGVSYLMPLDRKQQWNLNAQVTTAYVDYLDGLEQPNRWNTGVAGGILYRSPRDFLKILFVYAYGVDAIRDEHRGAHSVGVLLQFDLERAPEVFSPTYPSRWRGWRGLFGF
jgi:hypothetical protein